MVDSEFLKALASTSELEITVTGRKSGRRITLPVWFVYENKKLCLLPVSGSNTQWYRNLIANPSLDVSAKGRELSVKATLISDSRKVNEVVEEFRSKYGAGEIKKYYSKMDVAVEIFA